MPSIKKSEYEHLKYVEQSYEKLYAELLKYQSEWIMAKRITELLERKLQEAEFENETYSEVVAALTKTFYVEEFIKIPACFNPLDSIKFLVLYQEKR